MCSEHVIKMGLCGRSFGSAERREQKRDLAFATMQTPNKPYILEHSATREFDVICEDDYAIIGLSQEAT